MKRTYRMWALANKRGRYARGRITAPLPALWGTRRQAEKDAYENEEVVRVTVTIEREEKR